MSVHPRAVNNTLQLLRRSKLQRADRSVGNLDACGESNCLTQQSGGLRISESAVFIVICESKGSHQSRGQPPCTVLNSKLACDYSK